MNVPEIINPEVLRKDLKEKIDLGHKLLDMLNNNELEKVEGIAKLEKKVKQEVKFLEKFQDGKKFQKLKKEHINCSNLVHLESFISQIFLVKNPTAVLHPFNLYKDGVVLKKVVVDIVCEEGQSWVKVVARNPRALDLNSQGGNQFGQKSILDQVKEFVQCASQNEVLFKPPAVRFTFANGVTKSLHKRIAKRGAEAVGEIVCLGEVETDEEESDSDESCSDSDYSNDDGDAVSESDVNIDNTKVNLDITAMIAYVSALTNGRNWFKFSEKILSQQAEWERDNPVKPFLDEVFRDKQLICCASAMRDFDTIINTLGGPGERERAGELKARITVVPDCNSPRTLSLEVSGKIKERSRSIFGTGDSLKVLTVTANTGFIRAAQGQGVTFAVITHESRALTEDKEKLAVDG